MSKLTKCEVISFDNKSDNRGNLVVIENNQNIPFEIKRIFYISNVINDKTRGNHANIHSEFIMICLQGQCKVKITDGSSSQVFILNNKCEGLYIPSMLWKEMYEFSSDAILLVLSNEKYDNNEYISDFNKYLKAVYMINQKP